MSCQFDNFIFEKEKLQRLLKILDINNILSADHLVKHFSVCLFPFFQVFLYDSARDTLYYKYLSKFTNGGEFFLSARVRRHRQNVPQDKTSHGTKRPKDIRFPETRSQGQHVPRDKTSHGTKRPTEKNVTRKKHPKGQNVPRDKTSSTNYQVFNNTFCFVKLATYVRYLMGLMHAFHL